MSRRALPYPRPVPQLDVDEIPICPGTAVYFDLHAQDTDDEAEQRAAKRRKRVRENAEAYLRGEEIYIMTASLKGPFDPPWKNPWVKKRRQEQRGQEGSATVSGNTTRQSLAVPETLKIGQRYVECIDLTNDDIEFTQPPVVRDVPPKDVFKRSNSPANPTENHLRPTSAKRVEEWLRTNDAYKNRHIPDIRSSPTPTNREYASRLESQEKRTVSAAGADGNTEVGEWAKRFSSQQDNTSTQQTHESQQRAEVAILEAKRRSVHKVPASSNLPAFEYKRPKHAQERVQEVLRHPLTPDSGSDIEAADVGEREVRHQVIEEVAAYEAPSVVFKKPVLSTETSKATTIRDLPEAQVVSDIVPPASNVQSTAELLQPVEAPAEHSTEQKDTTEPVQIELASADAPAAAVGDSNAVERTSTDQEVPAAVCPVPSPERNTKTPLRNIDTQALLGTIQPFAISTIKKLTAITEEKSSPVTASKTSKAKSSKGITKKKKASFAADVASDESQSSIKAGFQVRKSASIQVVSSSKAEGTNPDEDDEVYDLDPPTNQINNHIANLRNKNATPFTKNAQTKAALPKSILKSRAPNPTLHHSSAPPGTTVTATGASLLPTNGTYESTSGTSATKQDAQSRPRDMFAIENGTGTLDTQTRDADEELQQFDLDTAVEELGSFLGTWDVEREFGRVA